MLYNSKLVLEQTSEGADAADLSLSPTIDDPSTLCNVSLGGLCSQVQLLEQV